MQESYPTPTTGVATPVVLAITGLGITQIKGNVYTVTLSLSGTSTVSATAAAKDVAGTSATYTGSYNWLSYNAKPTALGSSDVIESYPASTSGKLGEIATVSAATGNPITVTGQFVGQAIVEVSIPFGDSDGTDNYLNGKAYAQLVVNVTV